MEKDIKNSKEETKEEKVEGTQINNEENSETVAENEELLVEESETSDIEDSGEPEPQFKVKQLENKIKEQEESYARLTAEYANFRRRTSDEKASISLYANEKVMNELIPVIDNLERALSSSDNKEDSLYKGIDLVHKQMLDALSKAGMETIEANIGDDFDHNFHMAVMQEASEEFESNKIIMVLQKGYKLGNKILRAAMVKVSQ
nr:nucleotide exchange factor GrpE [Peptostreptococcus faecalis]